MLNTGAHRQHQRIYFPPHTTDKATMTDHLLIGYTLLVRTGVLVFRQRMCRHPFLQSLDLILHVLPATGVGVWIFPT
jgi:hypothetical protein